MEDTVPGSTTLCTPKPNISVHASDSDTPMIGQILCEGQELARSAHNQLLKVSHSGDLPVDIKLPSQVNEKLKGAMRGRLMKLSQERLIKKKKLAREYMNRRLEWELKREDAKIMHDSTEIDKFLLKATKGISKDPEAALQKIREEGGTYGGVARWGKSITAIPDQEPDFIPSSGGGILIENPLQEYFHSRNTNSWDQEEKLIFLQKFYKYGPDLRKIAEFLQFKSEGEVVDFYYKNTGLYNLDNLKKELLWKRKNTVDKHLKALSELPAEARIMPNS